MKEQFSVSTLGLGYIGLPTSALIASNGIRVNGMDVNSKVVDTINHGGIHIVEPKLNKYVADAVKNDYLTASTEVKPADVYLIVVPTPKISEYVDCFSISGCRKFIPNKDWSFLTMVSFR